MTGHRSDKRWAYFPLNFVVDQETASSEFQKSLLAGVQSQELQEFVSSSEVIIYFKKLIWDSDFFGVPVFRVEYSFLPLGIQEEVVKAAFTELQIAIASDNDEFYIFGEVPAEDTQTCMGMTGAGWRLIETRLTYVKDDMQKFEFIEERQTRNAELGDIPELRTTSSNAINPYDRFHADSFFSDREAADFMAVFAENSVRGFADVVLVPATGPADAFLTGVYLPKSDVTGNLKIAKPVLSAVSKNRKGWYKHLIGSMGNQFKAMGVDIAFMTTQSTNRAVQKVWFQHGFRFGRATHIFSTYKRNHNQVIGQVRMTERDVVQHEQQ